jgi:hypothetical protein
MERRGVCPMELFAQLSTIAASLVIAAGSVAPENGNVDASPSNNPAASPRPGHSVGELTYLNRAYR